MVSAATCVHGSGERGWRQSDPSRGMPAGSNNPRQHCHTAALRGLSTDDLHKQSMSKQCDERGNAYGRVRFPYNPASSPPEAA